ncbi:MAG: sulfide/dihydroorotate dehydrogenase-like FAD/NAD-binding protein [Nitrospirota bacterium]
MYEVLVSEQLVPNIHLLKIEAPAIARKALVGQFVVVMVDEVGERIPLSLADWDAEEGTITLVVMQVGTSTRKLAALKAGNCILSLAGPLGLPSHIERFGTVACIGGCYGIGAIFPIVRSSKSFGNKVISIIEARSKNLLYWQDKLQQVSDELIFTTGDGSSGYKGWAYDPLKEMLETGKKIDRVFAHGCTFMMRLISEATKLFEVKTLVALNPIMVDGTGMCGVCRVSVGGETKFACVDGPEFDGHGVDWEVLATRRTTYLEEEIRSLQRFECQQWYFETAKAMGLKV